MELKVTKLEARSKTVIVDAEDGTQARAQWDRDKSCWQVVVTKRVATGADVVVSNQSGDPSRRMFNISALPDYQVGEILQAILHGYAAMYAESLG